MQTESMKWNKKRTKQKFLTESHYNENFQNHQRAYSMVQHWHDPRLPTYQPAPLHKKQLHMLPSQYQTTFYDKSGDKR